MGFQDKGGRTRGGRPTIPAKLQKELAEREGLHLENLGGLVDRGLSHKDRRRLEKQQKVQRRQAWMQQKAGKKKGQPPEVIETSTKHPSAGVQTVSMAKHGASRPPVKSGGKVPQEASRKRARKTKFEELLAPGAARLGSAAEADIATERRLAKKLKLKDGKGATFGDGLDDILDGLEDFGGLAEDEGKRNDKVKAANGQKQARDLAGESDSEEVDEFEDEFSLESNSDSEGQEALASDRESEEAEEDVSEEGEQALEDLTEGHKPKVRSKKKTDQYAEEEADSESGEEGSGSGMLRSGSEASLQREEEDDDLEDRRQSTAGVSSSGREQGPGEKYVPPHLRKAQGGANSEEFVRVQRRVRGLLNRLSESNVESIASGIVGIFQAHSRHMVLEVVRDEILGALCEGPRGNDQYAATFAAFVCGIAASIGEDIGANFVSALALRFEEMYEAEDGLACRNLLLLMGHLHSFQLLHADLIYQLLNHLCTRFQELDVASMAALLKVCGFGLRAEDPVGMKDFVVAVQNRMAEARQASADSGSKRVSFMLETICDIKNNKRRAKDEPAPYARLKKWLHGVGVEEVQLRSLSWAKLLEKDKKGRWWLPPPASAGEHRLIAGHSGQVAAALDASGAEAERLLALATAQRMNTDARRAIFCIVMSSEDCVDAFEKLLRLKLVGQQERELVRVVVECCMQEKTFNRYYALLLQRLCAHHHNHKFTLQYCAWDHFKQLPSMELRRSANLARLLAHVAASHSLSLSALKAVDFSDPGMAKKTIMHFRILLQTLLLEFPEAVVWGVFSRLAGLSQLGALRDGLALFLHRHVTSHQPAVTDKEVDELQAVKLLLKRTKLALKAMKNADGSAGP